MSYHSNIRIGQPRDVIMVLKFILVYFVIATVSSDRLLDLTASKIEMTPNNTIQYLQFEDLSFNLTEFTICTWVKILNFTHTQTIIRLTGNKKESLVLWRMHVHPKETMRVTIKNRLVASESIQLTRGQWHHVCFQWKGSTGVWATFVNAKIHSVGQMPEVGNDMMSSKAWNLQGSGTGTVGDDSVPCRNGWQAYGLYLSGPMATTVDAANAVGKPSTNASTTSGRTKNNSKRQAVFDSDLDEPAPGGAGQSKSFQWLTKSFAFMKRMFTFVIIPFFKFVRNTFFQTRSLDDTVVDVSETHLTVSDVKFEPPSSVATVTVAASESSSDDDSDNKVNRRSSSSSKRETDDDSRCGGTRTNDDRVTAADLVAAGSAPTVAVDDALSPNAKRYLRMVSDGLNDVGVNAAFVKRAFACCSRGPFDPRADVAVIDWDRTRAHAHDVTASPHVCGRY
ncbi:uncharacterized protein LOC100573224 [Acyrthosiphon pisum]|uniref:Uncharacterized protein n=1 Tax=Acyrthosiphon pisum TaxID=7029 RepID=A0A8R2A7F1_ACYPI|nr:uncharacterized protein LOC100573224 [Acyrthosiphon pisum]|eukprot:XP_003241379.1 PREDICTED: uncharacterized protein LOC100573224 [Acyrthosiphon pisum]